MKHKIFFIFCCLLCLFSGCTNACNASCYIFSVPESASCSHHYICSNSHGSYIYQKLNGSCGIYDYESQKMLVEFKDNELFHCMAASDEFLVYHKEETHGTVCVYSFGDGEKVMELDHMNVCGLSADSQTVFMIVLDDITKQWDIGMFTEDEIIWLNHELEHLSPERTDGEYSYYLYDGYTLVAKVDNELEIVYIEKEDFSFSCSQKEIYIKEKDNLFCISRQPDFLPDDTRGFGGVSPSMLREYQGSCFFIAQYSKRGYRENPSQDFVQTSLLCKYNLYDESFEVLYKTEKGEQIVGFSVENSDIYLMTNEALYRENMESKQRELLLQNRFYEKEGCRGTYYFEDYGKGIMVFSRDFKQENSPRYEGFFEY